MLIAQITDTHLVEKDQHYMNEPATKIHERLFRVVSFLNHLDPQPDLVLLTGDATDLGIAGAYQHLKELLEPLKAPLFVIPGNHDVRENMRAAFYDQPYMPLSGFIQYAIEEYPLRFIALDTLVEGVPYGQICEARLEWLRMKLEEEPAKPTLIFMHHPPAKTGTVLFDSINCRVAPEFESLIRSYKNIVGIVSGHYHHLCVTSFGSKSCFIAPSVAPVHYFATPFVDQVTALELEDPAVTLHQWHGGTVLTSHVKRIKEDYKRIDWEEIQRRVIKECIVTQS